MKAFNLDESNLFPILPSTIRDSSCQAAACVRGSSMVVPVAANLEPVPSYQFEGWTVSARPEGGTYAHIKVPAGLTMVTKACIAEPGVADELNAWLSIIRNTIAEKHVHIPETSHLFLEIHRDSDSCNYYFADNTLRTVFWLHTLGAVGVRSQHSFTSRHDLQYALEENYWIHIELFPEAASQYSAQALNELQVMFLHVRADVFTSDTPTFPYTAKQREEIIDILERKKDHAHSSYTITYVAKLWSAVASHRLLKHFGEDQLSFGRLTSEIPGSNWSLLLIIISNTLLFGFPDGHQARFKGLWVDQLVNTSRWREHISESVEDLKQMVSSMLALLIANVIMMPLSSFPAFSSSSFLLCVLGLVTALFLMQEQRTLLSMNAAAASAVYLGNPNTSYRFAVVRSLPQALFTWALLLFAMQSFCMAFADSPLPILLSTFLPMMTVLVVACVGIWKALHPRPKHFEDATQSDHTPSLTTA